MKWYGNLNNRIDENKQYCPIIEIGTGVTEYLYSDRHAYEVIAVKDQKHVTIREYDHKHIGEPYQNKWELISNENNPHIDLAKRGKFWYMVSVCTPARAKEILETRNIQAQIWADENNFDLESIIASGKKKTSYKRMNVSFGIADYYYDYEL